jgi:hypothetical protein
MQPVVIQWGVVSTTGCLHHIHLSHHLISGRRRIHLDGKQICDETKFVDCGSNHKFQLTISRCNHSADTVLLKISSVRMGTAYRYTLLVNGDIPHNQHNQNIAKHLLIFNLNSELSTNLNENFVLQSKESCAGQQIKENGKARGNDDNANDDRKNAFNSTTTFLSCIVYPEILQVFHSQWPKRKPSNSSSGSSKCNEDVKSMISEEREEIGQDAQFCGKHSCSKISSDLGFSMDDEFQGVVHDCIIYNQKCSLYSDVMQNVQVLKINDKEMPILKYGDLLEMYPEFGEPLTYRKQNQRVSSTNRK